MTIPIVALPIAWTVLCFLAFLLWPYKRYQSDYGFDLVPLLIGFVCIIAALIGWIVYLALT